MANDVNMNEDLQCIGDEWAPRRDTLEAIHDFIIPYITCNDIVGEIGVGGGRI